MPISSKKIAVIQVARQQLGLTDDDYRGILFNIAGVTSSKGISDEAFDAVMFRFQQLGFRSTWNKENFGYRPDMATPRQVATMRRLWATFTDGQGTDTSLGKWLEDKFKVSSLRFLPADTARKAVGALMRMTAAKVAPPRKRAGKPQDAATHAPAALPPVLR